MKGMSVIKKILAGLTVGALLVSFTLTSCKKEEKVIKIGAILPLTGKTAFLGEGERNALLLAVEEINKEGINGKKIELIIEDSKGEPKTGVSVARKMIEVDKCKILITSLSPVSNAVQPICEKNKIIQLAFCMDPDIAKRSEYTFRIYPNMWQEAEKITDFIIKHGYKKVGIIYVAISAFEKEIDEYIKPVLKKHGIQLVARESFTFDTKDVRSLCFKVKKASPEALMVFAYPNLLPMVFDGLAQAGLIGKVQLLGNLAYIFELQVPRQYLEGLVFTAPVYTLKTPERAKKFIENYKKRYKKQPGYDAAFMYDAIMVLQEALKRAEGNVKKLPKSLKTIKQFKGVTGNIEILNNGDARVDIILAKFVNGKRIPIE